MSVPCSRALRYCIGLYCNPFLELTGYRGDPPVAVSHRSYVQYQKWTAMSSGGGGGADLAAGKKAAACRAVDECVKVVSLYGFCL